MLCGIYMSSIKEKGEKRDDSRVVPFVKYTFTEHQFETVMGEIDSELRRQGIDVANRSLHAPILISQKLSIDNFIVSGGDVIAGEYTSHNLGAHIEKWYKVKYGDKMKKDFRLGRMLLEIKGEYYTIGFPLIYGSVRFVCDTNLREYPSISCKGPVFINLLTMVEGLTKTIAKELDAQELECLCMRYGSALNAIMNYEKIGLPYEREALTDLETAVDSFFYKHKQYGQSKWHSLQFAEKLLKGVIVKCGKTPPFTHKLKDLSKLIHDVSGIQITSEMLEEIECKPEVRYSSDIVSAREAFRAHDASLDLLKEVIEQLPRTDGDA